MKLYLLQLFLVSAIQDGGSVQRPSAPMARDAIESLVGAFKTHDLVALSESHGCASQHEFLRDLVRDPRFLESCQDIIVEFASARYQDTLDDFLNGEAIPFDEFSRVWRETPVSPHQTWDSPVYFHFFETVRELNDELDPADRLRVWASEEPIHWEAIRSAAQHEPFLERSTYPATVVWKRVLAKGRKGFLLRGGGHLTRQGPSSESSRERRTVVQILVEDHGVNVWSVGLWTIESQESPIPESLLRTWPRPSVFPIAKSSLASHPANAFFNFRILNREGHWVAPYDGVAIGELFDAYLFLGPPEELLYVNADPSSFSDEYRRELDRRRELFGLPQIFERDRSPQ